MNKFQTLVISPQNLHEDVIELLGYTKLEHLHILQNKFSPKDVFINLVRLKPFFLFLQSYQIMI